MGRKKEEMNGISENEQRSEAKNNLKNDAENNLGNESENEAEKEQKNESGNEQESVSCEEELESKLAAANDKYLRLAAEFDNYRRRSSKERLDLIVTASEDVIKGLLPILDDCERAIEALSNSKDSVAAKEGTELIYNKLMSYLKSKGLAKIDALGHALDTDFHEAIAQFPAQNKKQRNTIIDVVQQGYTLNGKVVRFAKVVVGV